MRKKVVLGVLLCFSVVAVSGTASAKVERPRPYANAQLGNFDRMFPDLAGFTAPTVQQIADLAQGQLDPNLDSNNNCPVGATNPIGPDCTQTGFTYFGQFIDHDLTLDTSPSPTEPTDPTVLPNHRTLALDLDSLYGRGPELDPQFYDGDRFRLVTNSQGVLDLPRNPDGSAIIFEPRNDENQIILQVEIAMMMVHNKFVDMGMTFEDAREQTVLHYQKAVVNDFLPHILSGDFQDMHGRSFAQLRSMMPDTPVEFAVAGFRFGHSQVRRAYRISDTSGNVQVFSFTQPDLRGGKELAPSRVIDWGHFFHELNSDATDVANMNIGRRIDPLISSSLFLLPIPGAAASGSNVLAFRNMVRAHFYDMPSGQSVAQALGYTALTPEELNLGPGFETGTPLWYYILEEAGRLAEGRKLGPVGSFIVGGTFMSLLMKDSKSILRGNKNFSANPAVAGVDSNMTVSDLVNFSGTGS